jgi:Ni2+-binding GTPase involved in maturation of urease and hydrogenase
VSGFATLTVSATAADGAFQALKQNARHINPDLLIFETSCTTGAGLPAWCDWVRQQAATVHA